MSTLSRRTRLVGAIALTAAAVGVAGPATANAEPQGHLTGEAGVGFFYGTFEEDQNMTLLVGGSVEEFCAVGPTGDPGVAPSRVFFRKDGAVDVKVNDKDQPAYLYSHAGPGGPDFLGVVCAPGASVPEPYAVGTTDLKVRISDAGDGFVDIFNSVNGTLATGDGAVFKVRASADFVLGSAGPLGDPAEFVEFSLTEIKR